METPGSKITVGENNILVSSFSQITSADVLKPEDRIAILAITDDLTGLFNRRYFYQCLAEEIKKAEQSGTCISLMMIDIDFFKQINDTYGHLRGDSVLAEVGNRFKNSIRGRDVVIRYAGDEFIVLLIGASASEAPGAAQRIFKSVCETPIPPSDGAPELPITFSAGLATYPDDAIEVKQLIDKADQALYASKKAGRGRITVFSKMESELKQEIEAKVLSPCPTLVGRKLELAQISTLLDTAVSGRSNLLIFSGTSGIGKTRLLVELKNQAAIKKTLCLVGRGEETKLDLPYYPLLDMLKSYLFSLGKEKTAEIEQLLNPFVNEMIEMMPELKELGLQSGASTLPVEQKRFAILQGLTQVFKNLSQKTPLVILLDDLQWADEASIQFLINFSRAPQDAAIMVAAAYSNDVARQAEISLPLNSLLSKLRKGLAFQEIALALLEEDQVDEMIRSMLPGFTPPAELTKKIYQTTKGNPLFIEETLKELAAEGTLFFENGQWNAKSLADIKLPASLKEAVEKRMEHLDEETKDALAQAAALGDGFNLNILREVSEKNEGHLLDLIDKARDAELIREEIKLSDNRFDFVNHQIREVIYGLINKETKKLLHQKIGQAVEKLFGDNIEEFVSDLAYHYQRSDSKQKADEYSRRLAVKAKEFYGPGGTAAPEKISSTVPLDEETFQQASDYLRYLRAAITNFQLYPAGSKMRVESVQSAFGQLQTILDKVKSLTFSEANENLLIEGKELEAKEQKKASVASFVTLMVERGVKSLTFSQGLTEDEFSKFLEALNMRPEDIKSEGGLTKVIDKNNLPHISVNERIYVALGEQPAAVPSKASLAPDMAPETPLSEIPFSGIPTPEVTAPDRQKEELFLRFLQGVTAEAELKKDFLEEMTADPKRIAHLLKKASAEPDGALQTLSRMTELAKEEDAMQDTISAELIKVLAELDSATLTEILSREMPSSAKDLRIREKTLQKLSEEKILELIQAISQEYQQAFKKEYVGKLTKEKVFNLQKLLGELLATPKGRSVLPQAYPKLVEAGVIKGKETAPVVKTGERIIAQVNDLLKKDNLALLEEKNNQLLPMMVKELLSQNQAELAVKLIDKLLLNANDKFPTIRLKTFQTLSQIYDDCVSLERYDFVEPYERKMIHYLNEEIESEAYTVLVNALEKAILEHFRREEFDQVLELLGLFGRHRDPKSDRSPEHHSRLDQAFRNVFQNTSQQLLAYLTAENKETQVKTTKILAKLREYPVQPLIQLLKETDDLRAHKNAVEVFKEIGSPVIPILLAELDLMNPPYFLESAIEVIGALGDETVVEPLTAMLSSFDSQVRRKAIYSMVKIEGKNALPRIIGLLKDKDAAIRQDVVRIIGIFDYDQAAQDLMELIKKRSIYSKDEDDAVQREACMALGKIKDVRAIPFLIEALKREGRISLKRNKNEEVRAAAAWALGEFIDKRALKALREAVDDPSTAVQVIAQAALTKAESSLKTSTKPAQKEAEGSDRSQS